MNIFISGTFEFLWPRWQTWTNYNVDKSWKWSISSHYKMFGWQLRAIFQCQRCRTDFDKSKIIILIFLRHFFKSLKKLIFGFHNLDRCTYVYFEGIFKGWFTWWALSEVLYGLYFYENVGRKKVNTFKNSWRIPYSHKSSFDPILEHLMELRRFMKSSFLNFQNFHSVVFKRDTIGLIFFSFATYFKTYPYALSSTWVHSCVHVR